MPPAPEPSCEVEPDGGPVTLPAAAPVSAPLVSPWATFAMVLAPFVAVLSLMALGPFLPSMAADLGTSVGILGQIPALMNLVTAAMALIVGPSADQYGYRRVLLLGVLSQVLSVAGMSLAPTYSWLLVASLVGALGRSALMSVPLAFAGTHFHGAVRQRAISWMSAGMSGAGIVGIPALTFVASLYDWRAAFALLGAVTLVIGGVMWLALPRDTRDDGRRFGLRGIGLAYLPLVGHRSTIWVVISTGMGAAMMFSVITYLGALVTRRYGYSVQEVGWVFFAVTVAFLGGSLLAGGRIGRLPARPLLIVTRGLSGLAIGAAFLLPLPVLPAIGLIMLGVLANGISNVSTTLLLTSETPGGRATTMTLNSLSVNLGGALGTSLGGALLLLGDFPAFGVSVFFYGLVAMVLIWWSRPLLRG
jgi:predicted MFS family arabinose efflux permease